MCTVPLYFVCSSLQESKAYSCYRDGSFADKSVCPCLMNRMWDNITTRRRTGNKIFDSVKLFKYMATALTNQIYVG